ncbi:MAG: protocatechuate 3,4-dioxygenase subunit beta [Shimia sp.]
MQPLLPRDHTGHAPAFCPEYKSTRLRAPTQQLLALPDDIATLAGPVFTASDLGPDDDDLLVNAATDGAPLGERIILHGRVLDEDARPVPGALIELWQANAAGRYRHARDGYTAPLDPNFGGCGRTLSGADGAYRFRTIKPGAYPWPNGPNSWRPAHIHLSLFGPSFAQRLVTQLYFEGDPLIPLCPIVQSLPTPGDVARLVARLDMEATAPMDAIALRFDIVLRGRRASRFDGQDGA